MSTIYWLSILSMVVGFSVFLLSGFGVFALLKWGHEWGPEFRVKALMVRDQGWFVCMNYKYLLLGVIGLIVFLTI